MWPVMKAASVPLSELLRMRIIFLNFPSGRPLPSKVTLISPMLSGGERFA